MNPTIAFYDKNAQTFCSSTQSVEMSDILRPFLAYVKPQGVVLDLGCGTGRDSLTLQNLGYSVVSVDASEEMCIIASKLLGHEICNSTFEAFSTSIKFDGIWACASLLHVEKSKLPAILQKYADMLQPNGIFYLSFKYGEYCGEKNGRYFTDLTEESLAHLVSQVSGLTLIEQRITGDVRPERADERWLNAYLKHV